MCPKFFSFKNKKCFQFGKKHTARNLKMVSISECSEKILKRYGILNQKDFYCLFLIIAILVCVGSFTKTYINLDIYNLPEFKGDRASWDFIMPCLGGFIATLFYPKIHENFSLKTILRGSLIGLAIIFGLLIFLMTTFFDFPLRFCIGFLSGAIFLGLACFQADLFKGPYLATWFGISGIEMALFGSLGDSLVDFFKKPVEVFGISIIGILACLAILFVWQNPSKNEQQKSIQKTKMPHISFYGVVAFSPLIFACIFMMGSVGGGLSSYLAIFCEGIGLNEGDSALVYSFSHLGSLLLIPLAGRIADKWGYEKTLLFIIFIGLIGTILAFFFTQIEETSFIFFLVKGSKQAFIALMYGWIASQYSRKNISYGMATFSLTGKISYILAPLGVGFLMQSYGNDGFLYWIFGGMLLSFILIICYMKNQKT